jgi:ribosomal-protein-serine acetyltransferase
MTAESPRDEIIAGDGLILRKLQQETCHDIFDVINRNRHYMRHWLPFVDNTWKEEDTEIFVRSILSSEGPKRDIVFEIWHEAQFAGLIALKDVDRWNKKAEIGYWLDPDLENKGLMTKCCTALIDCSFRKLGLNRIQIKAGIGNAKSSRIPEKLGFHLEGIERAGEKFPDKFIDLEVYSILKKEWLESKEYKSHQYKGLK